MPTAAAMRLDPSQLIGGMAKKPRAAAGSDPAEGEPGRSGKVQAN